jgi:hypothetical protein
MGKSISRNENEHCCSSNERKNAITAGEIAAVPQSRGRQQKQKIIEKHE